MRWHIWEMHRYKNSKFDTQEKMQTGDGDYTTIDTDTDTEWGKIAG